MNGFLLTPMTRFYAEVLQSMKQTAGKTAGGQMDGQTGGVGNAAGTGGAAGSFAGAVQDQLTRKEQETQAAGGVPQTGGRNEQMIQAMSMEEYKFYIYQKIAGIPMNSSQRWDAVSVQISEEGFAAMKADPAYEKWVLDTLRSDFSYYNPWSDYCGGTYRTHYFGATREEYRGESFQMGFRNGDKRAKAKKREESFWDKRAKRHKLYMDLAQKVWYQRENEREYQQTIDLHRREVSSAMLQQWSLERATGEKGELEVNPSVLSQAATEFAQGYVFFKIPSTLTNAKAASSMKK